MSVAKFNFISDQDLLRELGISQQVIYCLTHTEAGNLLIALNHLNMERFYPCSL